MSYLSTGAAVSISIGIILFLVVLSESQDCVFENVNIVCAEGDNISEKALYVIVSVFFIILGYVLYKSDRNNTS